MVGILLNPQPSIHTRNVAYPRLRGGLGCSPHERRVATIVLRMFDLLASQHRLASKYRNLLRIGALLHDAGRPLDPPNHHVRGAELILRDTRLALSQRHRRATAYLVRYHRGDPTDVDNLLQPDDPRGRMRVLLGLLRAADALDSRHLAASAIVIRLKGDRVRIECLVEGDLDEARRRFDRPGKFKLLRKTLGLRVEVRVRQALA